MIWRFGDFTLDPAARLLLRNNQPVHLQRKTFELLTLLLQHRPNAISKPDLIRQLWPDAHVHEANLSNVVGELRKALGEERRQPRFVRTVHTFGYAFCGVTQEAEPLAEPGSAASPRHVRHARLVWGTTTLALTEGDNLVGRDDSVRIVLASTTVSRLHARIIVRSGAATIEDLGSQNGTWLNDRRIKGPQGLSDGDQIRFGLALVTYRSGTPAYTTERIAPERPSLPTTEMPD
jgi:DNA-binding winged helix-turn-helix (wHTH) protein